MSVELHQVEELCEKIMVAQRAHRHKEKGGLNIPRSTTASALGNKCVRRLVYARTHPHYARPFGEELCSILTEGDLHASDVRRELLVLGFECLESELPLRDEDFEIGAKIDGKLALTPEHRAERIVLEIKSCTGPPPKTVAGLLAAGGIFTKYVAQMQTYLFLNDLMPFGIFLFKDKITGLWYLVPVPLDYGHAEELLQKAEAVIEHMAAGTLPDRIADRSECPGCPFSDSICHPDQEPADPLLLVEDKELLEQLETRERTQAAAREYAKADASIKQRFKLTAGDRFVVGDENGFYVSKKPHGAGVRIDIRRL